MKRYYYCSLCGHRLGMSSFYINDLMLCEDCVKQRIAIENMAARPIERTTIKDILFYSAICALVVFAVYVVSIM